MHTSFEFVFAVATKWITYEAQTKKFCHVQPKHPYEVLVNGRPKYKEQTEEFVNKILGQLKGKVKQLAA